MCKGGMQLLILPYSLPIDLLMANCIIFRLQSSRSRSQDHVCSVRRGFVMRLLHLMNIINSNDYTSITPQRDRSRLKRGAVPREAMAHPNFGSYGKRLHPWHLGQHGDRSNCVQDDNLRLSPSRNGLREVSKCVVCEGVQFWGSNL